MESQIINLSSASTLLMSEMLLQSMMLIALFVSSKLLIMSIGDLGNKTELHQIKATPVHHVNPYYYTK